MTLSSIEGVFSARWLFGAKNRLWCRLPMASELLFLPEAVNPHKYIFPFRSRWPSCLCRRPGPCSAGSS